ncbi:MAG: flagellar motor protein MotB [Peptostreptococcaceae bacterium]|nr:flagellar motor protein MotB [Peptostreptococcaceae bacterium]
MVKRNKKSSGGGGPGWLATYSDMVTLLLCFFVLLYSISSVDAAKWAIVVKSFNPDAGKEVAQIITGEPADESKFDSTEVTANTEIDSLDKLYFVLSKEIAAQDLESDVEIRKGDGFAFVTFRNNVFFSGDSFVLLPEGKRVLDIFTSVIGDASDIIQEIQVLGHTSQASPDRVNDVEFDRFLSSNRATEVLVYIQEKNIIDPAKLVSSSYGQFRPVSPFDTAENRAKNRRVEILITENGAVVKALDEYYKEAYEQG